MDKIRDHINAIKLLIEDPSVHPQHTIAYPNKMVYYALLLSKDSYMYEVRNTPGMKKKPMQAKYFIPCIEMEEVDQSECPCAPNVGCTWMRSKRFLPRFRGNKLDIVKPVDTINQDDYGFINWYDIKDLKRSRKSQHLDNKYSLRNHLGKYRLYIHIFNRVKPERLSALAEIEDMYELMKFMQKECGCDTMECGFLDRNMDIPAEYRKNVFTNTVIFLKQMIDMNILPDRQTDDVDGSRRKDMA